VRTTCGAQTMSLSTLAAEAQTDWDMPGKRHLMVAIVIAGTVAGLGFGEVFVGQIWPLLNGETVLHATNASGFRSPLLVFFTLSLDCFPTVSSKARLVGSSE